MSEGWFKLHRCLFEKAIWQKSTPEQKVILITLLGMANHKGREWEWQGKQFKAEPGEFVTSINSIILKAGTGITRQNVRTALNKFKKYEFLTIQSTKTGLLVKIENWGTYQGREFTTNLDTNYDLTKSQPSPNQEVTNPQPTPNHDLTTNKNDKNIKNEEEGEERKEGKENTTVLPSLSFPTPRHKFIYENVSENSYKTWFENTTIEESETEIVITTRTKLSKDIIESKFLEMLKILTGKKITVKED